jgi:hypothetical protein
VQLHGIRTFTVSDRRARLTRRWLIFLIGSTIFRNIACQWFLQISSQGARTQASARFIDRQDRRHRRQIADALILPPGLVRSDRIEVALAAAVYGEMLAEEMSDFRLESAGRCLTTWDK